DSEGFDLDPWLPRVRRAMDRLDLVVFVPVEHPDRVANVEPSGPARYWRGNGPQARTPGRRPSESRELVAHPDSDETADPSQQHGPHREETRAPQRRHIASQHRPNRERDHDEEFRVQCVVFPRLTAYRTRTRCPGC